MLENIECLYISNLTFSLLLSFNIELYSLVPLTPIAKITGIIIIFCKSIVVVENKIPVPVPNVAIIEAIVYPNAKAFIYSD